MAQPSGERTEKATPKRRTKLRKEGSVAKSMEVNSTAVLLATLAALALDAPRLLAASEKIVRDGLGRAGSPGVVAAGGGGLGGLLMSSISSFAWAVAPVVIAAAAAGMIANVAQVGVHWSSKAIKPTFHKLNIAAGLKRMFGVNQAVELAKSLAKVTIIGTVAGMAIWSRMSTFGGLVGLPPGQVLVELSQLVLSIGFRIGAALFVIAALDYLWQRRKHGKSLKMTKDEVKREAREADVSPELRGQIRRKLTEAARKRMLADVPTADVVVVNPTHYAVALRYDGTKPAPEVVAKGIDHLALTIRRVAEEAGVTIVHEPPLARALYRDVDLGSMIPDDFFHAVAEVLAFVFRTAGRRRHVA
jgi:flagellar biosynthetic protein FlhB